MKFILPKSVLSLVGVADKIKMVKGKIVRPNYRFSTELVLLKASGGMHRCEATNGKSMAIITGVAEGEGEILVLARDLKTVRKVVLDKHTDLVFTCDPATKLCTIGGIKPPQREPDNTVTIDYYTDGAPGINGDKVRWPNTQGVLPNDKPTFVVDLDARLLSSLLDVTLAVNDNKPYAHLVFFANQNKPFAIVTNSMDRQQAFNGLMIPLRLDQDGD